jgi:hypothetical protein
MFHAGFIFLLSDNGVWLAEEVPTAYLALISRDVADFAQPRIQETSCKPKLANTIRLNIRLERINPQQL